MFSLACSLVTLKDRKKAMFGKRNDQKSDVIALPVEVAAIPELSAVPSGCASVIAGNTTIYGNIISKEEVRVEGSFHGTIEAAACIVGKSGVVEGNIAADDVVIHGRVIGPVYGVSVELKSGSHVEGDIVTTSLAVEKGAYLQGSTWQSDDPLGKAAKESEAIPASGRSASPLLKLVNTA